MPVVYALGLLIAFYALITAEVLLPSGGLLGMSAIVAAVTSIIIALTHSASFALTLTLIYLATTPVLFGLLIKLWPRTRIGRNMLNRDTLREETAADQPVTLDGVPLTDLVGQYGKATCHLRPHGQVRIENHKAAAVSTGMPIDSGSFVQVVRVLGSEVQVRQASETEMATWEASRRTVDAAVTEIGRVSDPAPASSQTANEPLTTSLEEINIEDLERFSVDDPDSPPK